eukprot:gene6646-3302_t
MQSLPRSQIRSSVGPRHRACEGSLVVREDASFELAVKCRAASACNSLAGSRSPHHLSCPPSIISTPRVRVPTRLTLRPPSALRCLDTSSLLSNPALPSMIYNYSMSTLHVSAALLLLCAIPAIVALTKLLFRLTGLLRLVKREWETETETVVRDLRADVSSCVASFKDLRSEIRAARLVSKSGKRSVNGLTSASVDGLTSVTTSRGVSIAEAASKTTMAIRRLKFAISLVGISQAVLRSGMSLRQTLDERQDIIRIK